MSTSLRQNLSQLTLLQLNKLSLKSEEFHQKTNNVPRNIIWQREIRRQIRIKQGMKAKKNLKKKIILIKKGD